ncbi:unnamed protein product [Medioppia subpectinata]|uniref:Uncharacterized protein n=1 Tax=Medioppia subpectinata TaxID=1979941 RepID=A0A7R9KJP2_9ACAR|nr:unnamed protein product [Medioppia subpectinata]CAG2104643.1 unnamed protein product [Medioppia subpectinata]
MHRSNVGTRSAQRMTTNDVMITTISVTFGHLLLLLTPVLLTVQLVSGYECLDKRCTCMWIKGKLAADCSLQKLTQLPQVHQRIPIYM